MRKIILLLGLLVFSVLQANELGETIALQGNGKGALSCVTCHGEQGEGLGQFPRLAGLDVGYLEKQLYNFQDKTRDNQIMWSFSQALTDEEVKAVSAYYAALDPAPLTPSQVDQDLLLEGKVLAEWGDWENIIPACVKCHGVDGSGVGKNFPAIAGQHAEYIESQLIAWKSNIRNNDPNQLMGVVAKRMNQHQIKAVSAYFASLPPIYEKK